MKYVGTNEVLKAASNSDVRKVYIGKDAEPKVVNEIIQICKEKKIEIIYVETMKELGNLAGIDIKAAVAAD